MLKDTTKLKEWIPFINSIGTDVGTLNDALLAEKETISQISNDVSSLQAENTTIKSDIQSLNTQKASKSEIPVFDGIAIKLNGTVYGYYIIKRLNPTKNARIKIWHFLFCVNDIFIDTNAVF